jgi:hypothetical protein
MLESDGASVSKRTEPGTHVAQKRPRRLVNVFDMKLAPLVKRDLHPAHSKSRRNASVQSIGKMPATPELA